MTKKKVSKIEVVEVSQEATTIAQVESIQSEALFTPEDREAHPEAFEEVQEVDELYVPVKKPMKIVKTVKTGVGQQILQLLADGVLSNKEIVAKVLEDNPLRKTTYACVAWYQSQVRAGKIDLPEPQEEVMQEDQE